MQKKYSMAITQASKARAALARGFKTTQYKRHAHAAASTKPLNIEKKRREMQEDIDKIAYLCEAIFNPETSKDEKSKLFNMANLVMMRGFLKAKGLDVDISTIRIPCTIRKKDGTKKKGYKRRSTAELLAAVEEDGSLSSAADLLADIRDGIDLLLSLGMNIFFPMFNEFGRHAEVWHDRDGISSPDKYEHIFKDVFSETLEEISQEEEAVEQDESSKKKLSVEEIKNSLTEKENKESEDAGS